MYAVWGSCCLLIVGLSGFWVFVTKHPSDVAVYFSHVKFLGIYIIFYVGSTSTKYDICPGNVWARCFHNTYVRWRFYFGCIAHLCIHTAHTRRKLSVWHIIIYIVRGLCYLSYHGTLAPVECLPWLMSCSHNEACFSFYVRLLLVTLSSRCVMKFQTQMALDKVVIGPVCMGMAVELVNYGQC